VDSPPAPLNEEAFAVIRASYGKTAAGRLLLGAGALALLIPAIAGCEAGDNAPTLQFHAASSGAQATVNDIRITNMFVLGAPADTALPSGSSAGLFLSIYNGGTSSDTLESVTAPGLASITLSGGPVALPANAAPVNLTGPQPEAVLENLAKPLRGGSFIPVTLQFARAGAVTMQVPVEPQSYQWETFSAPPAPASSASSATATGTASPASSVTATATGTASPTSPATPAVTASASPTAS
jgi:copper(I)-binding protein